MVEDPDFGLHYNSRSGASGLGIHHWAENPVAGIKKSYEKIVSLYLPFYSPCSGLPKTSPRSISIKVLSVDSATAQPMVLSP